MNGAKGEGNWFLLGVARTSLCSPAIAMVIEQLETGRLVAREKLSVEEWWPAAWSKVQEKHCGKILEKPNSFIHINGFLLLFSVDRDVPDVPSAKAWICWSNLCQNIYNISPNLPSLIAWRKWLIFFCVHIVSLQCPFRQLCIDVYWTKHKSSVGVHILLSHLLHLGW